MSDWAPKDIKSPEDVKAYLAELDRERPTVESHFDRRLAERREADDEAAKAARAKEVETARQNQQGWSAWAEGVGVSLDNAQSRLNSIEALLFDDEDSGHEALLLEDIAKSMAESRAELRKAVTALKREVSELRERIATTTGKLPQARRWTAETVAYRGQLFVLSGSLYQARRDTAKTPGRDNSDLICVAECGADGKDGATFSLRGPYMHDDAYSVGDVVEFGGTSFAARRSNPKTPPGLDDGVDWQQISPRGQRGERGHRGAKGERGDTGGPEQTLTITGWLINRERFEATPQLSNGRLGATLHLRPLFALAAEQTSE